MDNHLVDHMTIHHVRSGDISVLIGNDSLDLLHSVTTQDVNALSVNSCIFASILDSNGRMNDRILIMNLGDQIALIHLEGCAESSRILLSKAVSWKQDVKIIPLDDGFSSIWVHGIPDSEELWNISVNEQIYTSQICLMREQTIVHLGPDNEIKKMQNMLIEKGSITFNDDSLRLHCISNGIIDGKIVSSLHPIPLEVGLNTDISFTKGCYTGQEIIARMHAREALSRTLVTITSGLKLNPGILKISSGGKFVVFDSIANSSEHMCLGLLHPDMSESGNEFEIDEIPCRVVTRW